MIDSQGAVRPLTRRKVLVGAGTLVTAPTLATVVQGATDSGFVELEVTATIPIGTNASIRAFEDLDGDGSEETVQVEDLSDGTNTYEYDALDGFEGQGYEYWFEIMLESNESRDATPEIDSMTVTLPEAEPDEPTEEEAAEEPQGIFELWDNFLVFTTTYLLAITALGLTSKSMAVASFGAFLTFAYIAVETGHSLLTNILYVSLVMVFVGFAFKLWRLEGGGE